MMSALNQTGGSPAAEFSMNLHPILIVTVLVAIVIVAANAVVLCAYLRTPKLHRKSASNFLLMQLAVADLIVGLSLPVYIGLNLTHNYNLVERGSSSAKYLCAGSHVVVAVPLSASTFILVLVILDRFISLVHPLVQPVKTLRRYILVAGSWFTAFIFAGVIPFTWATQTPLSGYSRLTYDPMVAIPPMYWKAILLPATFFIVITIASLYMKIFRVAKKQIDSIQLLTVQVSTADRKNMQNIRLAKTGCALLGAFLLCWLPYLILMTVSVVISINSRFDDRIIYGRLIVNILARFNSAINPFIYAARVRRFRMEIKRMFHCNITNNDKFETYEIRRSYFLPHKALHNVDNSSGSSSPSSTIEHNMSDLEPPKSFSRPSMAPLLSRRESRNFSAQREMVKVVVCRTVRISSLQLDEDATAEECLNSEVVNEKRCHSMKFQKRSEQIGTSCPAEQLYKNEGDECEQIKNKSQSVEINNGFLAQPKRKLQKYGAKRHNAAVLPDNSPHESHAAQKTEENQDSFSKTTIIQGLYNTNFDGHQRIKEILFAGPAVECSKTLAKLVPICQQHCQAPGTNQSNSAHQQMKFDIFGDSMKLDIHTPLVSTKPKRLYLNTKLAAKMTMRQPFQRSYSYQPQHRNDRECKATTP